MREILFRGKRVDDGEWKYGNYVPVCFGSFPCKPAIVPKSDGAWEPFEIIPETLSQYTGLTANGKKIFEGDILNYYHILYIISWSDTLLTYIATSVDEKKESLLYLNKANMNCVYIVGNIHDNPELLEVSE